MKAKKIILSSFFAFLLVMSFFVCFGLKVFADEFTEEHFTDEYYQNISHGVPPQVFIQEYLAEVQDKYSGNYIMGNWDYNQYRSSIDDITADISGTAAELGFEGNVASIMWDIEYSEGFETYAKAEAKKKYYNETFVPKIKEDTTKPGVVTIPKDSNAIGFSGFFKVNVYSRVNTSPYNRSYRIFYVNDGYGVKENSNGQVYYEFYFKDEPVYMIDYNPAVYGEVLKASYENLRGGRSTFNEIFLETNLPIYDSNNNILSDGEPLETETKFDPETLTDEQKAQLMDDFLKEYNFTNPDLSTVEGILRHIDSMLSSELAKEEPELNLDELATKLGCHCLTLDELNSAILTVAVADSKSPEILEVLYEIRNGIISQQPVSTLTGSDINDLGSDIGNNLDDLGRKITNKLDDQTNSLKSKLDDVIFALNVNTAGDAINSGSEAMRDVASEIIEGFDNIGDEDDEGLVEFLGFLVTGLGYSEIRAHVELFQTLLLFDATPSDIKFSLDTFGVGEMTLLKASDFQGGGMFSEGLQLAKGLVTIWIVIKWLKWIQNRVLVMMEVFSL